MIDVEALLKEVAPDAPCGEDPSYDPDLLQLEQLVATGSGGDTGMIEGGGGDEDEPDWKEIRKLGEGLLARTKHLSIPIYLGVALIKTGGADGLRDGLALLRGLLERYWDEVHPQLDPDDDNDPTERMNIIAAMAKPAGTYGDPLRFQQRIREMPLAESRQLGRFTLRDVLVANGKLSAPDGDKSPDAAVVEAAFKDSDPEELATRAGMLAEAMEHVQAVEEFLTDKVGASQAIDLSSLVGAIREAHRELSERLPASMAAPEPGDGAAGDDGGVVAAGGGAPAPRPISGQIASREDVVKTLDKICEYYEKNEPSSPVPLLLKRARKLVYLNFLDILQDLSPDALREVTTITGIDSEEEEG